MRKKTAAGHPLKIICGAGLALALVIFWCMVIFVLQWGRNIRGTASEAENSFARSLRRYDAFDAPARALQGENPDTIEKRLSALQKQAGSVEEHLSVLKRRRALTLVDRRYGESYAKAAQEAAEIYTYSAPLAAVAAEAVLTAGTPPEESSSLLKNYAARISQNRFGTLELGAHILAGNLDDPSLAAKIPGIADLLSQDFSAFPAQTRKELLADKFLILANTGDVSGASLALNALLDASPEPAAQDIRMGAEFYYDHGEPLKAAELFLQLAGDENNARAADALVLAGETAGARNIWLALSSENRAEGGLNSRAGNRPENALENLPSQTEESLPREILLRTLYNLAASAPDRNEETALLEKLFSQTAFSQPSPLVGEGAEAIRVYSAIRYTRLLETERAAAVLDDESMKQNPLLDLELVRRKMEEWPPKRAAAEVWLLLGRHGDTSAESETVYEWAAWYFDQQKLYSETAQLLKEAERKGMTSSWFDLHRGLALIREGKTAGAEEIFIEAVEESDSLRDFPRGQAAPWQVAPWQVYANLGRIQESRRTIDRALGYYERAAALVKEKTSAAEVQVRLSRCLETLGRSSESRRAIEYAMELDPENINIRREFRRLGL